MRSEGRLGAAGAALAVAAALAGGPVARSADRLRLPAPGPRASAAQRAAAWGCVRKAVADWRWIGELQYCASGEFWVRRGDRLPALARGVADADPTFVPAYLFAGAMLMWTCEKPREAAALLERGIAANPGAGRLAQYLAAFTYQRQRDLGGEIALLERMAEAPDAPFIVRRILANAYESRGRIADARRIWALVVRESGDPRDRGWAERKLQRYASAVPDR